MSDEPTTDSQPLSAQELLARRGVEEHIERGELRAAREAIRELLGGLPTADAPDVLANADGGVAILLSIVLTLEGEFASALGVLEALASTRPRWRTLAQELTLCAVADQLRWARLDDPGLAARRAGIAPPPEHARTQLEAFVRHARGDHAEAAALVASAHAEATPFVGRLVETSGRVVDLVDLRDSDDLAGPMLEGFTSRGLLDVPWVQIAALSQRPARTLHDAIWPVVDLTTTLGPTLTLRVPALYPRSGLDEMGPVRVGSFTTWERERGYAIARGHREIRVTTADGESRTVAWRDIARIQQRESESAPAQGDGEN